MNLHQRFVLRTTALVVVVIAAAWATAALAVGINDFQLQRTFSLPPSGPNSGGNVLFDPLPNGRLLVVNGADVLLETGVKSGTFASLGPVGGFTPPSYGPSFLAVSPDGTRAAVGANGNAVVVFNTSNPAVATTYTMADSAGQWFDNRYLAMANFSTTSGVQVLDTQTSTLTQVIANIGGASAGVAFDAAGNMYAGNGYDNGPGGSEVGWIKAFSLNAWQTALATNTPLNFETTGTPIADLLSGYSVGFDVSGNMYVGGGDFFGGSGDSGYAALIDAAAVASALANPQASPPITPGSSSGILRKFISPPNTVTFGQPPNWNYNTVTGELYLNYAFGDGNVSVYGVPEPCAFTLIAFVGIAFAVRRTR